MNALSKSPADIQYATLFNLFLCTHIFDDTSLTRTDNYQVTCHVSAALFVIFTF